MFQFLIGKVKIHEIVAENIQLLGFQFLIGKVKIFSIFKRCLHFLQFQFLIGKVKIKKGETRWETGIRVSIPYR